MTMSNSESFFHKGSQTAFVAVSPLVISSSVSGLAKGNFFVFLHTFFLNSNFFFFFFYFLKLLFTLSTQLSCPRLVMEHGSVTSPLYHRLNSVMTLLQNRNQSPIEYVWSLKKPFDSLTQSEISFPNRLLLLVQFYKVRL